jgi:hypothetical protein
VNGLTSTTLSLLRYLLEREQREIESHWVTASVTWSEADYKNMQAELARVNAALIELATIDEVKVTV